MAADRLSSDFDHVVDGTSGNDELTYGVSDSDGDVVGGGNDVIDGGDGADTIAGAGGDDTITGGTGNDAIFGDMADGSTYGTFDPKVTDNLLDGGGTETAGIRAVELVTLSNSDLIMITSERGTSTDGIASYKLDNDPYSNTYGQIVGGQIDAVTESSQPIGGAGYDAIEEMAAITLSGGSTFVYTADREDDTIGVAQINSDGTLTPQNPLTDNVNLDRVMELSTAEVGGQPFLLALSGGGSDSLVAYQINSDGSLTQTDIETDGSGTGENYLNNLTGTDQSLLEAFTNSNGETFVITGGEESGIALWTLNGSGQLTFQNARGDGQAGAGDTDPQGNDLSRDIVTPSSTGLNDVNAGAYFEHGGETYLAAGGNDDDVDIFRIDVDTVNGDGAFDLTLVGHLDDLVTDISTMAILPSDDGPILVVGGKQTSLETFTDSVNPDGSVNLDPGDTISDGSGGATELADSESIAVEDGLLVSASDNDNGLTVINSGLAAGNTGAGDDSIDAGSGDDLVVGGAGSDTVDGGTGADTIRGDGALERESLNWQDFTTTQVRDGFTTNTGNVDVTFSSPTETGITLSINNSSTLYSDGIEDDGSGVDPNSSMQSTTANSGSLGEYN